MAERTDTDHYASPSATVAAVLKQVLPIDRGFDLPRWVIDHEYVLGREPGSGQGIALPLDSKLSKQHARLRPVADGVEVVDLNSKNHTFVDGVQVSQARMADGAVLRVGNTLFVLRYERVRRSDAPRSETALHKRLLGQSPEVSELRALLSQAARSSEAALLLGPTGAGKELGARAIHALSARQDGPFVAVNCAAIPANLAESQLFGHVRGAFTGADRDQDGFFQQAHRGTLFLDEVGELPLPLQAKLLRALQPVEPIGPRSPGENILSVHRVGAKDKDANRVDVRILAATNADLAQAVKATTFREDLLQRLAVLPIHFPSLDQRRDDVLPLFLHALNGGAITAGGRSVMARLGELLLLHHWSGNVRELVNISKRMGLLGDGRALLDLDDLPDDLLRQLMNVDSPPTSPTVAPPGADSGRAAAGPRPPLTREILERLLIEHRGNRSIIAQLLKRDRKTIRRRMDELGIPRSFGSPEGARAAKDGDNDDDSDDSA